MNFQEKEIISCILTMGVVLFVLVNYSTVARIPRSNLLLLALVFLMLFHIFTIGEGIWAGAFYVLNLLEHICYVMYLVVLAAWCGMIYRSGDDSHD